jgi:hypothetical protein
MSTFQLSPNVGESPEHIAFRLFELVISEGLKKKGADLSEKGILETYARCLLTVRKPEGPINWSGIAAGLQR